MNISTIGSRLNYRLGLNNSSSCFSVMMRNRGEKEENLKRQSLYRSRHFYFTGSEFEIIILLETNLKGSLCWKRIRKICFAGSGFEVFALLEANLK